MYVPLGKKTIEGVESDGMLASAAELGISRDHSGIVELKEPLTLTPDYIIEVDNKSLTHRPDLWGHYGMAREVAAILGKKLLDPVKADAFPMRPARSTSPSKITRCARATPRWFSKTSPSSRRLCGCNIAWKPIGLNPISNIVDVTNFVMAELAQPMHAFDADKLHGGQIIVRIGTSRRRIRRAERRNLRRSIHRIW